MTEENKKETPTEERKTPTIKKRPVAKKVSSNEAFKRKYFEYYDDVKISDRQDW